MTRKAFLIESSNLKGETDLPGARLDVDHLSFYLQSPIGGAWRSGEIEIMHKPKWEKLKKELEAVKNEDYVFISFSGHGYHPKDGDVDDTKVMLCEEESIPVWEINPGNDRCTFVIDSCRNLEVEEGLVDRVLAEETFAKTAADKSEYRRIFDLAVAQADKGIIRLYSCGIDESAAESKLRGGLFTSSLIECANEWHQRASVGQSLYYSTEKAFECASVRTTTRTPQQKPDYEPGRRNKHFPFGVKP